MNSAMNNFEPLDYSDTFTDDFNIPGVIQDPANFPMPEVPESFVEKNEPAPELETPSEAVGAQPVPQSTRKEITLRIISEHSADGDTETQSSGGDAKPARPDYSYIWTELRKPMVILTVAALLCIFAIADLITHPRTASSKEVAGISQAEVKTIISSSYTWDIGPISATLVSGGTETNYAVPVSFIQPGIIPENGLKWQDVLEFTWSSSNPCGTFSANQPPNTAHWDRHACADGGYGDQGSIITLRARDKRTGTEIIRTYKDGSKEGVGER